MRNSGDKAHPCGMRVTQIAAERVCVKQARTIGILCVGTQNAHREAIASQQRLLCSISLRRKAWTFARKHKAPPIRR